MLFIHHGVTDAMLRKIMFVFLFISLTQLVHGTSVFELNPALFPYQIFVVGQSKLQRLFNEHARQNIEHSTF
jgi:hypothetical protein